MCQGGHGLLLFLLRLLAVCAWEGAGLILLFCFHLSGNNEISPRLERSTKGLGFFVVFFAIPTTVFACVIYPHFSC